MWEAVYKMVSRDFCLVLSPCVSADWANLTGEAKSFKLSATPAHDVLPHREVIL